LARLNNIVMIFFLLILISCSTKFPNQPVLGKVFPQIKGRSLLKKETTLPDLTKGKKAIYLLGFVQNSQFDIDRWLIGLDMRSITLSVYEIPTIQGLFPRFFSTKINNGMRKGIPKELWKGVITVYKDGAKLQNFTGNKNPNNARLLLLDSNGKIIYFNDKGFSVKALNDLISKIESNHL